MASNRLPISTRVRDPYDSHDLISVELHGCSWPIRYSLDDPWWKIPYFCIAIPINRIYRRYKYRPRKPLPKEVEFNERCSNGSDSPEPLASRRRALTPTPPVSGAASGSKFESISIQQQSLVFSKLPMDVRYMIYQYVAYFSGHQGRLHLVNLHKRLRSVPCYCKNVDTDEDEYPFRSRELPSWRIVHDWQHSCWKPVAFDGTTVVNPHIRYGQGRILNRVGGLLCSCRQAYAVSTNRDIWGKPADRKQKDTRKRLTCCTL